MDTSKLEVGQGVFVLGGAGGGWAKVIEVTPTGVIVELDSPGCGLLRFDKNGAACDSSDIDLNQYKDELLSRFIHQRMVPTSGDDVRLCWENLERCQKMLGGGKLLGTEDRPVKLYRNALDASLAS